MAHVNRKILQAHVEEGLVTEVKHPVADLWIYNYTPKTQYAKLWNEVTLMCRGLIVDAEGKVVAQPLPKFFNFEEFKGQLPSGAYRIAEKMDGSLGICYPHKGVLSIATRGSFTSEQAKVGDEMLQQYIKDNGLDWYDEQYTYLFEIIYPANRIVVNYGEAKRLVLLAVVNTNTGMERNPHETGYKDVAKELPPSTPIEDLRLLEAPNEEGFVLHWGNGLRLKIKFAEYVRLHRILTGVSNKDIWRYIAVAATKELFGNDAKQLGDALQVDRNEIQSILDNGTSVESILDKVPDEFYEWVRSTVASIEAKHDEAIATAAAVYDRVQHMERKQLASAIKGMDSTTVSIVWALVDDKTKAVQGIAWRYAKPDFERPFMKEVE
jgi:RNA ligase